MKDYKIPIICQVIKEYNIEADSLQEAVTKALQQFFADPSSKGDYIEDSFEVDGIIEDNYPNEDYDSKMVFQ
jgi:uncharacterized protein Yka (UPF0111/DUF47 family)